MAEKKGSIGAALQGGEADLRREAARLLGQARSERKAATSRLNGQKGGRHVVTEEMRAKLREAQRVRRERERQEKIAAGLPPDPPAPKRPRGRPRKEAAESAG